MSRFGQSLIRRLRGQTDAKGRTDWGQIEPRAKQPPPAGQPMHAEYVQYLRDRNIEFIDQIGSGTYGSVWRARITKPDNNNVPQQTVVACKIISLHSFVDKTLTDATNEMIREATIVQGLSHPHLVKCELVMHVEEQRPTRVAYPYTLRHALVFMELCDHDLNGYLFRTQRAMPESIAYNWFVQIVDALHYLYYDRLIAHLDIKPGNILIKNSPQQANHVVFKLADFGLAQHFRADETSAYRSERLGTRVYMAPEVVAKQRYDACRADVYSLGVTLAQTLVGFGQQQRIEMVIDINVHLKTPNQFPYATDSSVTSRWNISVRLLRLMAGMLEIDPTRRFDTLMVWFHEWVRQRPYNSGEPCYLPP